MRRPVPADTDDIGSIRRLSVHAFRVACETGDARMLAALFAPHVTLRVDSGGLVDAPLGPVRGATVVIPFLLGRLGGRQGLSASERSVNGQTAVVFRRRERVVAIACLDVRGGRVKTVWLVASPSKLRRWNVAP